ncbi:MAG: phytoene desaturase family protein [Nocardioides sp.]
MAVVIVIGGGLGGIATAARLAKLGHVVTVMERATTLGGALATASLAGFTWDAGPTSTLLPAVLRDLFRKTGRPLESEVSIRPMDPARVHRFSDGSSVALPSGSRSAQAAALAGLGGGLDHAWLGYVASFADLWAWLRRDFLERPYDVRLAAPETRRLLASRESLAGRIRRSLPDPRLRAIAALAPRLEGHQLRQVPAWVGVEAYLAQRFGEWQIDGGSRALALALASRLATRGVDVRLNTRAVDLVVRKGRLVAVATRDGTVDCDVVVCATDPRCLPALRVHVQRTRPTTHPRVCHLAVTGPDPFHAETAWHGSPLLIARPGRLSQDASTLTLLVRGEGDPVDLLADRGADLRGRILARLDQRAPAPDSSAYGVRWRGRGTIRRRLGPSTPIPGVYAAGAHANPGSGLPWVGLSAAAVAQRVGPA